MTSKTTKKKTPKTRKTAESKYTLHEASKLLLQNNSVNANEYYRYIQARPETINSQFKIAYNYAQDYFKVKYGGGYRGKYRTLKLLDVGAGIGGAVVIMRTVQSLIKTEKDISIEFTGLEIDKNLIPFYEAINGLSGVKTIDALEYEGYKDIDIIYFYHPISNNKLMTVLENKLVKDAKIGTLFIRILKPHYNAEDLGKDPFKENCLNIKAERNNLYNDSKVWQKIK